MEKKYNSRVYDDVLKNMLKIFGAINIVGPKWCGKTTTAEHQAKSVIKFQSQFDKEALNETIKLNPYSLLEGEKPRLVDEWQDGPGIWDVIRVYIDDHQSKGDFILTGSTSKKVKTSHTGTGRIATLKMLPMSLYESKESTGTISLQKLFDGNITEKDNFKSNMTIDDLVFAACRGGWPSSVNETDKKSALAVSKEYFRQIYENDIFNIDNTKRNPRTMKAVLHSYARNISTLAKKVSILDDVNATNKISPNTLDDYIDCLERLHIIEDLYGWTPSIRSKNAIRSGRKREFVDPSIAVNALNTSYEKLRKDMKTFGFIFETLCIRDLKAYSAKFNGELSYYHDRSDLEADAVLHLDDGRYALIEFKLGMHSVNEGAEHLNKLEKIIKENRTEDQELPTLKLVITGTEIGGIRDDGVYVIPIGCLKD